MVATYVVESLTEDSLKDYMLTIEVFGLKFSFTLFALAVAIVGFVISH